MTIEVKYDKLYDLGEKMKNHHLELEKDLSDIDDIADSLIESLHGESETILYNRIKSFNDIQFKKLVDYTDTLGECLKTCAKKYNSEEESFTQEMRKESANYEQYK